MPVSSSSPHDHANQILTNTLGTSSAVSGFTDDHAGNMTTQPPGPNSRRLFTWDAWNRLVRVEVQDRPGLSDPSNDARTRAVYTYYGMHQRATAIADADLKSYDATAAATNHELMLIGWSLAKAYLASLKNFLQAPWPSEAG